MVSDKSLNVKYVEVQATGEEKPLKNISKSGAMHTAWNVWGYQTRVISKMLPK